ncbi:MAG: hypothetical protein GY772_22910 [bacterium]|nr:hypothetical protein [bacterium]
MGKRGATAKAASQTKQRKKPARAAAEAPAEAPATPAAHPAPVPDDAGARAAPTPPPPPPPMPELVAQRQPLNDAYFVRVQEALNTIKEHTTFLGVEDMMPLSIDATQGTSSGFKASACVW